MSMYRQLWLAIILSTLLAMLGSMLASTLSAREYLSEQLAMKNSNNVSALALSLNQQNPDAAMLELTVSALFDSGHYELIRIVDPLGKPIVERRAPPGQINAPRWFTAMLPITAPPGTARITSGWNQVGTITLVSDSRFAYQALWQGTLQMMTAMAFAGLFGGYLGTLILRRLRRPLQDVINQARAITERRFITIEESSVPELRQLAVAMNATVRQIKSMFAEEAARLETVRREANCDPLTGLANRNFFMAELRQCLDSEEGNGGTLLLVRVANLAGINQRLGRSATDDMVKRIAGVIAAAADRHADGRAARLNGADFAILLPHVTDAQAEAGRVLQLLIDETASFVDNGPSAFIGVGSFPRGMDMASLLAQVDAALAAAEAEGNNAVRIARSGTGESEPTSSEEWERLIRNALDQRLVRLISFPVTDFGGRLLHRECPLRLRFDADGDWLAAGQFLPIAERLKLTPPLDLTAIRLGLEELEANAALPGLAVNISGSSLAVENFHKKINGLLDSHPKASTRLWLEVAEIGAFRHFDAFRALCLTLRRHGCHVGIEHFGRQFSKIGLLHDLGLRYLKIDASFIRGIDSHPGNEAFLNGLSSIAHNIGLQVIAEGVISIAELQLLEKIGFDGATGPAVRETG